MSTPEPIRHKINRLRGTVEEYYGSEFQVIPIKRFLSRALTYIQTYIHTNIQSQNSIHAECTTCSAWIKKTYIDKDETDSMEKKQMKKKTNCVHIQ